MLTRNDGRAIEIGKEFVDGSQAMAWELAVRCPEGMKQVHLGEGFVHLTGFFRIAETIRREEVTLRCNFPLDVGAYAYYSYLSSFCIPRDEAVEQVGELVLAAVDQGVEADLDGPDLARDEVVGVQRRCASQRHGDEADRSHSLSRCVTGRASTDSFHCADAPREMQSRIPLRRADSARGGGFR